MVEEEPRKNDPPEGKQELLLPFVYAALWQHALEEDKIAESRFYNFTLVNSIFLLGAVSDRFLPLDKSWLAVIWCGCPLLINMIWWHIGRRIFWARRFWRGSLRKLEASLLQPEEFRVFASRDSFFHGKEVEIINREGKIQTVRMGSFAQSTPATRLEFELVPILFLLLWLVVGYSRFQG